MKCNGGDDEIQKKKRRKKCAHKDIELYHEANSWLKCV